MEAAAMSDLLIRNIEPELKRLIEERARRSRNSLSEEAKALIRKGLNDNDKPRRLGTELFKLLPAEHRGDDLEFEIPGAVREPPDFK
jgi:antitoxin FitA